MNKNQIMIIEVSDQYVNYMTSFFNNTMLCSKEKTRKHRRKYIGVILKINNYNYFAPLSSPKASDYQSNGDIKKSTISVLRMTKFYKNKLILLGTIKLNNMFPVPDSEIDYYDANHESDQKYKTLIMDELKWIKNHSTLIYKRARILYEYKCNENNIIDETNIKFLNSIISFKKAEEKCKEYSNNAA